MKSTPLDRWIPDLHKPLVIAGPCSAESEEQVLTIAHAVNSNPAVKIFRAGIWKPRTRPNNFEGVGEVGLSWMKKVKSETSLLTSIEVANARHIELALKYDIDILWIGARTTASPFAVQEIAEALQGTNIPVMVKNPVNAELPLWIGALERINKSGTNKLIAIHRGFTGVGNSIYRNLPMWEQPMELKRLLPELPIICDPSHIAGDSNLIESLSQKAIDLDLDGLMIETHQDPPNAISDAKQQVTPKHLDEILNNLTNKTEYSLSGNFENNIEILRAQIDRFDNELIGLLKNRMQVVEQIGKEKEKNNITALQIHRLAQIMEERTKKAEALGISKEYITEIFKLIHSESLKLQTRLQKK
ncbi:MAG: bifunctional 3-deoxy-7-phosphoheptulonate synthase/chorismate mutase type II [Flavobacteriales bacterium]|nr:bifunctional 3-deoxy-7-phosphoheptulonate synthase/chorismate mutase type II [Flavobacteriales bacterium]